jgi:RNA polymerase sigma factor (sigma-70 family)
LTRIPTTIRISPLQSGRLFLERLSNQSACPPPYDPLLERARNGDREALEGLFERLSGPLRDWARGRLPRWARHSADTADIVQEALLNTFRRLDRFRPRRYLELRAYVQAAIRNRIRDEIRRARSHGVASNVEALDRLASAVGVFDVTVESEQMRRYRAALGLLCPADQELIVGRMELGYSYEQLAAATGRPTGQAARMAIRRALVRLGQHIEAVGLLSLERVTGNGATRVAGRGATG